ncbi:MAG: Ig-like domain-containing protein [Clostridiales bacterium]|nr:Ig-like domain-containing protein [Clostridiales bacterium]
MKHTRHLGKRYGLIGLVLFMLCFCLIPVMKVHAETISDQVSQVVSFGEFDELKIPDGDTGETITLKVVLKEKGSFVLDFRPGYVSAYFYGQLYDENINLIGNRSWLTTYSLSPSSWGYSELDAGTYYIRLWADRAQNCTYYARFAPSESSSLELCISLKKGKSVQLGTIFNNSKDKKVKWSSSKKSVAAVSSSGKVTAKKKGTTIIKAYNSSGLLAKIKVKVSS